MSALFLRVSLGLAVVIGLCFAALRFVDSQLPLAWIGGGVEQHERVDPGGTWRGNWGRYPASLHLTVEEDQLDGNLLIELPGGHRARIHTQGTFDRQLGVIRLRETPHASGESNLYELLLSPDGMGLTGHIDTTKGEREEFRMVRQ